MTSFAGAAKLVKIESVVAVPNRRDSRSAQGFDKAPGMD